MRDDSVKAGCGCLVALVAVAAMIVLALVYSGSRFDETVTVTGKYVRCRDCECSSGHLPGGACSADEHGAIEAWNARWERTCRNNSQEGGISLLCSACGAYTPWIADAVHAFAARRCGNCGAKVVEE